MNNGQPPPPLVILVLPRFTDAIDSCLVCMDKLGLPWLAIATYRTAEERRAFVSIWPPDVPPLLILPQSSDHAQSIFEAVTATAGQQPHRPVVLLIGDGPDVVGFDKDLSRRLACHLGETLADVQVFQYSPQWPTRPPRIR